MQQLVIISARESNNDEHIASLRPIWHFVRSRLVSAWAVPNIRPKTRLDKNTPRHLSPRYPGVLDKFFTQRVARREYTVQKTHYSGAVGLFRDAAPSRGVGQQRRTAVLRLCQNRELTR